MLQFEKGEELRQMPELTITELPVSELVEYANNAKLHPHEQVDQIASSIQEFGNNDPIAVWHNDDGEPEIVEGHGRVMALRKLGIQTAPVIYLDHLTDEQRRAYSLVHNKLTMNSDFDFEILAGEIEEITSIDMEAFDFEVMNFDPIQDLLTEDFAKNSMDRDGEFFAITFVFPSEFRETVEAYVKEIGKESISQTILEDAKKWA